MSERKTSGMHVWFAAVGGIGLGLIVGQLIEKGRVLSKVTKQMPALVRQEVGTSLLPVLDEPRPISDNETTTTIELKRKIEEMHVEYQRLKERYDHTRIETQDQERVALFRALEPVLVQLPIIAADYQAGVDISTSDVLGLTMTLIRRLQQAEITLFEAVGNQVVFDPRLQKPISSSAPLSAGDPAIVVCPGFLYRDEVLTRAEVKKKVQ